MLDLSKNNPAEIAEAGYEFTVVLPDGTETDAKIKVRGANSPVVKAFGKKLFNEFEMKRQAAKRRGKDPEELSLDDAEDISVRGTAIRVISWTGIAENGVEVACTPAEVERILKAYPFIRDQVKEESDNILNFRHE